MPPAASPSVSEKIRLMTRPRPMACSTMVCRPIAEMKHDLLPQPHDVADSDNHSAIFHQVEQPFVDLLRGLVPEVAHAFARISALHRLERHQLGSLAREH